MFVRRVYGRLTSCLKPSTIFVVSVFDKYIVVQMRMILSGVEQQCSDRVVSSLRTFEFHDVLVTGLLTSVGEPSTIFVGRRKQSAS